MFCLQFWQSCNLRPVDDPKMHLGTTALLPDVWTGNEKRTTLCHAVCVYPASFHLQSGQRNHPGHSSSMPGCLLSPRRHEPADLHRSWPTARSWTTDPSLRAAPAGPGRAGRPSSTPHPGASRPARPAPGPRPPPAAHLRLGAARQPLPAAPPAPGGGPRQREEAGSAPRPGPAPRRGTKVPLQPPLGPLWPLGPLVGAVGAQPASGPGGPRNAASPGLRLLGHTHMHTKSCCRHMGVRVLKRNEGKKKKKHVLKEGCFFCRSYVT